MKYSEINKKFTDKVGEYISNGYVINSGTMTGSQSGDITNVDLTDGHNIVRVRLANTHERDGDDYYYYIALIVGIKTENARPNMYSAFNVVWDNEFEAISEERFYSIGNDRFWGDKRGSQSEYGQAL